MTEPSAFKLGLHALGPAALTLSVFLSLAIVSVSFLIFTGPDERDGSIVVAVLMLVIGGVVALVSGVVSLVVGLRDGGTSVLVAWVTILAGMGFVVVPLLAAFVYFLATTPFWNLG